MSNCQFHENQLPKLLSCTTPPYVFLETILPDKENKNSYLFTDFIDILTFNHGDDPDSFFNKAQSYLKKGYWLCGYFAYEFGYCLEPALKALSQKNNFALAWLGVSKKPRLIHNANVTVKPCQVDYTIDNIHPNINQDQYSESIQKIKYYLEQGLTYQVNYTFKIKFKFCGSIPKLYLHLRDSQPTPYAALIDTGLDQFISLSPELFFRIKGKKIITRPMKGTIERGKTMDEDKKACAFLRESQKMQAENVMIVDLLRNDLGRISKKVRVPKIFEVEKYRTLHQMTSTIQAKLRPDLSLKDIFSSLFPSGSVTGAPKIKTMEIIKKLEKEPRGIYTGSIGYISPDRDACFNVAIRTIHLKGQKGELGVGGGIVYDSLENSEYDEAMLKAKFFMQRNVRLSLIESILWADGKYYLLDLHLARLKSSCDYFSIPLDIKRLKRKIIKEAPDKDDKFKVRIQVDMAAQIIIEKIPLDKTPQSPKVKISSIRINPKDYLLYHKTTQRDLYDLELAKAKKEGFFEVIFLNTRGELTEGSITNLFIEKDKQLYTPVLSSGLLPGVLRQHLIEKGQVKEKVLYREDLTAADRVYIGNSVRGLIKAEACPVRKTVSPYSIARK
jgi:para-aminobenzoate synthetase/4-amino-4-deoxychorismate lyase